MQRTQKSLCYCFEFFNKKRTCDKKFYDYIRILKQLSSATQKTYRYLLHWFALLHLLFLLISQKKKLFLKNPHLPAARFMIKRRRLTRQKRTRF